MPRAEGTALRPFQSSGGKSRSYGGKSTSEKGLGGRELEVKSQGAEGLGFRSQVILPSEILAAWSTLPAYELHVGLLFRAPVGGEEASRQGAREPGSLAEPRPFLLSSYKLSYSFNEPSLLNALVDYFEEKPDQIFAGWFYIADRESTQTKRIAKDLFSALLPPFLKAFASSHSHLDTEELRTRAEFAFSRLVGLVVLRGVETGAEGFERLRLQPQALSPCAFLETVRIQIKGMGVWDAVDLSFPRPPSSSDPPPYIPAHNSPVAECVVLSDDDDGAEAPRSTGELRLDEPKGSAAKGDKGAEGAEEGQNAQGSSKKKWIRVDNVPTYKERQNPRSLGEEPWSSAAEGARSQGFGGSARQHQDLLSPDSSGLSGPSSPAFSCAKPLALGEACSPTFGERRSEEPGAEEPGTDEPETEELGAQILPEGLRGQGAEGAETCEEAGAEGRRTDELRDEELRAAEMSAEEHSCEFQGLVELRNRPDMASEVQESQGLEAEGIEKAGEAIVQRAEETELGDERAGTEELTGWARKGQKKPKKKESESSEEPAVEGPSPEDLGGRGAAAAKGAGAPGNKGAQEENPRPFKRLVPNPGTPEQRQPHGRRSQGHISGTEPDEVLDTPDQQKRRGGLRNQASSCRTKPAEEEVDLTNEDDGLPSTPSTAKEEILVDSPEVQKPASGVERIDKAASHLEELVKELSSDKEKRASGGNHKSSRTARSGHRFTDSLDDASQPEFVIREVEVLCGPGLLPERMEDLLSDLSSLSPSILPSVVAESDEAVLRKDLEAECEEGIHRTLNEYKAMHLQHRRLWVKVAKDLENHRTEERRRRGSKGSEDSDEDELEPPKARLPLSRRGPLTYSPPTLERLGRRATSSGGEESENLQRQGSDNEADDEVVVENQVLSAALNAAASDPQHEILGLLFGQKLQGENAEGADGLRVQHLHIMKRDVFEGLGAFSASFPVEVDQLQQLVEDREVFVQNKFNKAWSCVGWFHSHLAPNPFPSYEDLQTSKTLQGSREPKEWVGLICSVSGHLSASSSGAGAPRVRDPSFAFSCFHANRTGKELKCLAAKWVVLESPTAPPAQVWEVFNALEILVNESDELKKSRGDIQDWVNYLKQVLRHLRRRSRLYLRSLFENLKSRHLHLLTLARSLKPGATEAKKPHPISLIEPVFAFRLNKQASGTLNLHMSQSSSPLQAATRNDGSSEEEAQHLPQRLQRIVSLKKADEGERLSSSKARAEGVKLVFSGAEEPSAEGSSSAPRLHKFFEKNPEKHAKSMTTQEKEDHDMALDMQRKEDEKERLVKDHFVPASDNEEEGERASDGDFEPRPAFKKGKGSAFDRTNKSQSHSNKKHENGKSRKKGRLDDFFDGDSASKRSKYIHR